MAIASLVHVNGNRVDWVELCPYRLRFHEAWDGLYDT